MRDGDGVGVVPRTADPARRGLPLRERGIPSVLSVCPGLSESLRAATGVSARAFAYPFGTHDLAARTAVAAAGHEVAFAVAREHGRSAVDRVFVRCTDSLPAFRLELSGGYRLVSRAGVGHGACDTSSGHRSHGYGQGADQAVRRNTEDFVTDSQSAECDRAAERGSFGGYRWSTSMAAGSP